LPILVWFQLAPFFLIPNEKKMNSLTIVNVIKEYKSVDQDHVSVFVGEKLLVTEDVNEHYYRVKPFRLAPSGLVPKSCVEVTENFLGEILPLFSFLDFDSSFVILISFTFILDQLPTLTRQKSEKRKGILIFDYTILYFYFILFFLFFPSFFLKSLQK